MVARGIIWPAGLEVYRSIHERLMSGELTTPGRHDLGAYAERQVAGAENVGQIMWPSDLAANAREGPLHQRGYAIAAAVMGDEAAFDFDMLIWKEAHTDTETPWHQDIAYWPAGMTDTRALTVWAALDAADVDNGAGPHDVAPAPVLYTPLLPPVLFPVRPVLGRGQVGSEVGVPFLSAAVLFPVSRRDVDDQRVAPGPAPPAPTGGPGRTHPDHRQCE